MIQTFWLVFPFCTCFSCLSLTSCICLFCLNYWLYIYILEPLAFMHIRLWTRLYLDMYVYFSFCTWHTYTLKDSSFDDFLVFHVLRNFIIELNWLFSWLCVSHNTCTLTLFDVFSWFCFHEYNLFYIVFECLVIMWSTCFFYEIYFCLIPCLKDFVLVYKFFI